MSNIAAFSGFATVGKRIDDNTILECDEEEGKDLDEDMKVILYPIKLKMNNVRGNKVRKVLINSSQRK